MAKLKPLTFNDLAPDVELRDTTSQPVRFSTLWAAGPVLLVFTRHFGCTQCKEMLDQISASRSQLSQAGLKIAIITQGTPETAAEFCQKYAPGQLCLADPERRAYEAYGIERGNLFQTVLSPKVWEGVSKAGQKGYHLEPPPPGQDALQLSGVFIIGPDGRVRLPYYYDDITDHPALDLLVQGVLSTKWDKPFDSALGPDK